MHWREALSRYAERHEEHCVRFSRKILEQADRVDLVDRTGPAEAEFVAFLETGVVE